MEQLILKEELGISNKVSLLTLKIKEIINNDFGKIKNNKEFFKEKRLTNKLNIFVIENKLSIAFEGEYVNIVYYIALPHNDFEKDLFLKKYKPECTNTLDNLTIYIPLIPTKSGKIDWSGRVSSLQHEVHHVFQLIKRHKPILNPDEIVEYNKFCRLINSQNEIDKYIGFVFYYSIKAEKEAFANSIYREIMEINKDAYIETPINILKNNSIYKIIKKIKLYNDYFKENKDVFNKLKTRLNELVIDVNYFFKVANNLVETYIKCFGSVICKINSDLERLNKKLK